MPRITADALYALLPAHHRLRDADNDGALADLIAVLAREGAAVEEQIEQLIDDLFIETCAEWAVPYVAAIIGYRPLTPIPGRGASMRAEAANTIPARRRKGTAAVLEQLARDVTGWPARVVEYFQLTSTCQHMNHVRADRHPTARLRDLLMLEPIGRAFESTTRSVDVRSIAQGPGRRSIGGSHNFPSIGLHLWRLVARRHTNVPATPVDPVRFLFDPLGAPRQLVNRPDAEQTITHLAEPVNVAGDITRRQLDADRGTWYPRALEITVDGAAVEVERIEACDLSDDAGGWNHSPHGPDDDGVATVRVDPALGRIAFVDAPAGEVRTTHHSAFPGSVGGGEYDRAGGLALERADFPLVTVPSAAHPSISSALGSLPASGGIVELVTNGVFDAPATIAVAGGAVELRAADGTRPVVRATTPIVVSGAADAALTIDGVVVDGAPLHVEPTVGGASLGQLRIAHATLVPGLGFDADGSPAAPLAASLRVGTVGTEVALDRVICGPIQISDTTTLAIADSAVDAAATDPIDSPEGVALSGLDGAGPAGAVSIVESTVVGLVLVRVFELVSNSILHARSGDQDPPVRAEHRQRGCMRFSYVPPGSITPRRYRCQPQLAIDQAVADREAETGVATNAAERAVIGDRIARWLVPGFTALSASAPAYLQLRDAAPIPIRTGASDESEMGVWHHLHQPQREANLRVRLDEFLRFGLEAGLFHET